MSTAFSWIHLSDIHMGHGGASHVEDQRLVLAALKADLSDLLAGGHAPRPDALLVTGDIAFSGNCVSPDEYLRAARWLRSIAETAGVPADAIFVVPGNHDVQRPADRDRNVARLLRALRSGAQDVDDALRDTGDRAMLEARKASYLAFAADFAPACRADAEKGASRLHWRHVLHARGGLRVRLVGLDTALLAADEAAFEPDRGRLRLGKAPLADTLLDPPDRSEVVVVLGHHPFRDSWLADERDAEAWTRRFADIHLSGHLHEADIEQSLASAGSGVLRIHAGAAHGEREPDGGASNRHRYNLASIEVNDGRATLRLVPRLWSPRNRAFRVDVDLVRNDGARHIEAGLPRLAVATEPSEEEPSGALDKSVRATLPPGAPGTNSLASPTTREGVYEALCAMLESQFHEVAFRIRVPVQLLPGEQGPLASRAQALVRWAEGTPAVGLVELAATIERVLQRRP